ncbi:MAG: sugar transferase, partial [Bacteroidales bacterium]
PVCSRITNEKKIVGTIEEIDKIIHKYRPDELIVALNRNAKQENQEEVIKKLYHYFLPIKIVGSDFTPSFGYIQMNNLMTRPYTELPPEYVPSEYLIVKNISDRFFALLLLILLTPLFGWIAAMIWRKEGIPILYRQTRIGYKGNSFTLYKFRTMVPDAERDLPLLSGKEDNRITRTGSFLRKHRLDELPQLFNVLRGEMSFIGPRPERDYYIQTIVENHPEYYLLQRVKPGITSLGMVKYGYADSVEKMIKRSTYDLIYLRNINPVMDLRIIFYTLKTIAVGKGI